MDFLDKIREEIKNKIPEIVMVIMPGGKHFGGKYSLNGISVNTNTGEWFDSKGNKNGKNIIELWSHYNGTSESESLYEIAKHFGIEENDYQIQAKKKSDKPKTEHPKVGDNVFDSAPFRILGIDHDRHFYLTKSTGQVITLESARHNKLNLYSIAPMEWWESKFGNGRGGSDWDAAVNALFIVGAQMGIYNESRIRGCGVWHDEGRVIIHFGNRLMIDGKELNLHEVKSKFIYEASHRRYPDIGKSINVDGAKQLIDITKMLAWERTINAELLAGWCYLAPICGALEWRPHIWLTGSAGSGKT